MKQENNVALKLARRIAWLRALKEKQELINNYSDLTADEMEVTSAYEWHLDEILKGIKKEDWHA